MISETNYRCPECGNKNLTSDEVRGEIVCVACGLVLVQRLIDSGPEWRAFTKEESFKRSRIGSAINVAIFDKGLTTEISPSNRDALGNLLEPIASYKFKWLRKWDQRMKMIKSEERNISEAIRLFDNRKSILNLHSDMKKLIFSNYRKVLSKNLTRGRSIEKILAGTVYLTMKQHQIPILFSEICAAFELSKKTLNHNINVIQKELYFRFKNFSPINLLPRICSENKISQKVQNKAVEIINRVQKELNISGLKPAVIAAAALYLAGKLENESLTQKEIASSFMVSDTILRQRFHQFRKLYK